MKKCVVLIALLAAMLSGCSSALQNLPQSSDSSLSVEEMHSQEEAPASSESASPQEVQSSESSSAVSSLPAEQKPAIPPATEPEVSSAPEPVVEPQPPADPVNEKLKAQIYKEFGAGTPQKKFIYPVTSDWTTSVTNYSYDTPLQAHLSWKISWILEGMYYAYKATGDDMFLQESVQMYDTLLKKRDDVIGRPAFDGNVYPLWGSTSRYNGSFYTLTDADGNRLATLQFHSQGNDQTYVAVKTDHVAGTFTLNIRHKDTTYTLAGLTLANFEQRVEKEIPWSFYGSPRKDKHVVEVIWLSEDAPTLPKAQDYTLVENTNVPTPIHTALILEPMTQTYIELKKQGHPDAKRYQKEIKRMFDALLATHWDERGFFKEMDDSPTFLNGGGVIPWNQQLPLVSAMALYAKEENDAQLKQIVNKACSYFMTKVTATKTGYLWRYWEDPSNTVTYWETTNYAALDLNSIQLIHSAGLGFSDADMAMFAKTIENRILKNPSAPATRIDGSSPSSQNLVLMQKYLPFSPLVPQIASLVEKQTLPWDIAAKLLYFRNIKM
ncbi:hypothetical protein [Hydrogenoanaerobacterium sp.]|uniref:hypothetical protein n=1 Tax=Hydrogenoanaerobacterium sp. TaxID=2953763 RepID=UPI00289C466F|nr:hypothetical protein [Hydrogenoanaerobacterium sp.]